MTPNGLRRRNRPPTRAFRSMQRLARRDLCEEVCDARHSLRDKGGRFAPKALPSVREAGDASEAFLRIAAPTRLL